MTFPNALFERQAARAKAALTRPVRLKEIVLPAGDVTGFAIDFEGSTGLVRLNSSSWLSEGYDGIRIVGQGMDRTHIRQNWFGWTMVVLMHPGIVQLEELTLHTSSTWGGSTLFGFQNTAHALEPLFQLRALNVKFHVDAPLPGEGRGKFDHFGYQYDEWLRHVIIDATQAREHGVYAHGAAKWGRLHQHVHFWGAGAQCKKERPDYTETAWCGPDKWDIAEDCVYQHWYQLWSDRGGAADVLEGGAANVSRLRCVYYGGTALGAIPANARSHAVMISSEAAGFDRQTGKVGQGYGNDYVKLRQCAAVGYSDVPWNSELVSIYRNGGGKAARGVLIDECGLWGHGMVVNLGAEIDHVTVRGCNTPEIRLICARLGMNVNEEAKILGNPLRLVSEGLER